MALEMSLVCAMQDAQYLNLLSTMLLAIMALPWGDIRSTSRQLLIRRLAL